jgi:lipopolysaccharide/colanic/teichoic acid biosynthesis glycosyltransferase
MQMNASLARPRTNAIDSAFSAPASVLSAPYAYRRLWRPVVLLGDCAAIATAFFAAYLAAWHALGPRPGAGACVVAALIILMGLAAHDLHERTLAIVRRDEFYYAAGVTLVTGVAIVAGCFLTDASAVSHLAVTLGVLLSIGTTGAVRYGLRAVVGEQRLFEPGSARVLSPLPGIVRDRARYSKRAIDIVLVLLALPVAMPLLALAALAIKLEDRGPVFYRQTRLGKNGRPFAIFKLRSMRVDAEARTGPVWAAQGDARTTRVGRILRRLSIDELPQLFNVLRGEMSVVGPRPERPAFTKHFSRTNPRYVHRLIVAPGLTACSHLYMPRSVGTDAVEQRLSYDLFYIRHWSIAMDVALIIKTAVEVVFHEAA